MDLAFLSGTHSTEELGEGTETEEGASEFFHILTAAGMGREFAAAGWRGCSFLPFLRCPFTLPSTKALCSGGPQMLPLLYHALSE